MSGKTIESPATCGNCIRQYQYVLKDATLSSPYCWHLGVDSHAPDDGPCHALTATGRARFMAVEK